MKLNHRLDGETGAPALVLSPSLGATLGMWAPQVEELAARFLVVRYDRRGHGRSPVPPGPYSLDELGRDLVELLDELGLERVSFCGLSLGGMVGMWLASEAPERVDRLVLSSTAPALPPREQWLERAATVRSRGVGAIADAVLARWFTPAAPAQVVERFRELLVATPAEGYAGCCEALAEVELHDRLAAIKAPTLVLTGSEDSGIPPATGAALAAAIAGASHTNVPGAAHLVSAEQPARFNELLLDHLTEEA